MNREFGRVVKALDLRPNGIFPRGFEPHSSHFFVNAKKKPPHSSVVEQKTVMVISYLLVTGSNPVEEKCAHMAKWISREASNLKIRGSSPRMGLIVLHIKNTFKTIIKYI